MPFAGDAAYYAKTGQDFRLNDDWRETQASWASHPVLATVGNTDFLQAVTMLATRKRHLASSADRAPAISAKREDVLKLELEDYLEWRMPLREAFVWASTLLADWHIFAARDVPYASQLVPLAAIRVDGSEWVNLYDGQEMDQNLMTLGAQCAYGIKTDGPAITLQMFGGTPEDQTCLAVMDISASALTLIHLPRGKMLAYRRP